MAALGDYSMAKPKGNFMKQPCEPKESPVHLVSFTQIFGISKIGAYSYFKKEFSLNWLLGQFSVVCGLWLGLLALVTDDR